MHHHMFHEAKRRHHIVALILLVSWIFALIAMVTTGWISVSSSYLGTKTSYTGGTLCCHTGAAWYWGLDSACMIIILIVIAAYLVYMLFNMHRHEHECPAHMLKTDLSVSAFCSILYIFVIISFAIGVSSSSSYVGIKASSSPGYSYYLALIGGLCCFGATGTSGFFFRSHHH